MATQPGAGVVVRRGLPLGPNAITGDEYLRVELAEVEVSRSGLAGLRTQLKISNVLAQRSFTLVSHEPIHCRTYLHPTMRGSSCKCLGENSSREEPSITRPSAH
jgi:hypothetical protein